MANGVEETGAPEKVHISQSTYLRSKVDSSLAFEDRGKVMVRGVPVHTYFVRNPPGHVYRGPGAHEKNYSKYIEQSLFGASKRQGSPRNSPTRKTLSTTSTPTSVQRSPSAVMLGQANDEDTLETELDSLASDASTPRAQPRSPQSESDVEVLEALSTST